MNASQFRQNFFSLLDSIQKNPLPIVIEKRGTPVAILLDYGFYENLERKQSKKTNDDLFTRLSRFQKKLKRSRGHTSKTESVKLLRSLRDES
jgi:prevent-host-death family protein